MKRYLLLLLSLLMMLVLVAPAGVVAQDDGLEVTLFVTEDHAYSVALIGGWAADGNSDDGLTVANSEDALAKFDADEDPAPGDFAVAVLAVPGELVAALGLEDDATAVDVLEGFLPFILEDPDEPIEAGEVEAFDFAGREAASVPITTETGEGMYVAYQIAPETLGIGIVAGAPGTMDEMGELGLQILATARYSPVLEEQFDDDAIAFDHPAEWLSDGEGGIYTLTNDAEALDADELTEGQFGIIIFDLGLLGYSGDSVSEVATEVAGQIEEEGQVYSEAIEVEVGDATVAVIDMTAPETDGNEGGVMVVQRGEDLFGVVFLTSNGESYQIGLIALNVLLSTE